jgi:hypothetical protein
MPIAPGEHAALLRAIGRLLDAEFAENVQLVNNDAAVTLSWRKPGLGGEQRSYRQENLEELRRFAAQSRGTYRGDQADSLAELLRTVGQDLDRERWKLTRLVQEPDGWVAEGWLNDRPITRKHLLRDLVASSKRRREWRRSTPPADLPVPPSKFEPPPPPGEPLRSNTWGVNDRDEGGPLSRRLGK